MTNKEYLTAYLEGLGISEVEKEALMVEAGINAESNAEPHKCKMAVYRRKSIILKDAMRDITEGEMTIKWNTEIVKAFYGVLSAELEYENSLSEEQ